MNISKIEEAQEIFAEAVELNQTISRDNYNETQGLVIFKLIRTIELLIQFIQDNDK